ncbi:MAG: S53 family peptidase [Verrucomicrobia bacterium]|nr:S53 family peptidase [Verrucomicrobiota bacterium]
MNRSHFAACVLLLCGVVGSTTFGEERVYRRHRSMEDEALPPFHIRFAATAGPAGYTPAQIRHAYGFDQFTSNGAGQKIAIVDAYGSTTIQNDLNVFCKQFGLPTTSVLIYYPQGKPSKGDSGWALETALDVEWAHAIAPKATILLVVAKTASLNNLLGAVDYAVKLGASQVSMSWGASEFSGQSAYDFHFNRAGVTFTASSGDNGAGVLWPAVSPYVVAVGGTTLKLGSTGNVLSEIGWSGSGGGTSAYTPEPAFQQAWQSSGKRMVPDVSYDADPSTGFPVYDSTSYYGRKGWFQVGGTSAGAPQWAALIALANASRTSPLGLADPALYTLGSPLNFNLYYRDVISGSNGGYSDTLGYDEVTGLGSPLANDMVPALITY